MNYILGQQGLNKATLVFSNFQLWDPLVSLLWLGDSVGVCGVKAPFSFSRWANVRHSQQRVNNGYTQNDEMKTLSPDNYDSNMHDAQEIIIINYYIDRGPCFKCNIII